MQFMLNDERNKNMATALRQISTETWGDRLRRHLDPKNQRGSMSRNAARVKEVCGPRTPSRNVFAQLFEYEEVPTDADGLYRAWLIITASGYNPNDFGVPDSALPPANDPVHLRDLLLLGLGCLPAIAVLAA